MRLETVTMTGADESVDWGDLFDLSQRYPFVEWGILASHSQTGESPRFPGRVWLKALLDYAEGHPMNLSLHLCGKWVRQLLGGYKPDLSGILRPAFQRIQLNFHRYEVAVQPDELGYALSMFGPQRPLIFQLDGASGQHYLDEACLSRYADQLNILPLFDLSGGAGVAPDEWPQAFYMADDESHSLHGYAGGLGPDNLTVELARIAAAAGPGTPLWIDMETKIRSHHDQQFDLDKVQACLEICKPYVTPRHPGVLS